MFFIENGGKKNYNRIIDKAAHTERARKYKEFACLTVDLVDLFEILNSSFEYLHIIIAFNVLVKTVVISLCVTHLAEYVTIR